MFKNVICSLIVASLSFATPIAFSATFGKTEDKPSTTKSSTTTKSSSSAVSQAKSATTAKKTESTSSSSSGSLSKGQSVGMTRSAVTQSVRDGSYKQSVPANNTTVAGAVKPKTVDSISKPTEAYRSESYSGTTNNGYNNGYNSGYSRNYRNGNIGQAVAVGAIAGYVMHSDSYGNTYYTKPNQPGIAYDINGNQLSSFPVGNYKPVGTVSESYTVSPTKSGVYPTTMAPMSANNSGGNTFVWIFLVLALMAIAGVIYYFTFVRKPEEVASTHIKKEENFMYVKNPEEQLRDDARELFVAFQKNNCPSQISLIEAQSDPLFFDAIKDSVLSASDYREIKVQSLESEVVDISKEGTKFIGSIRYRATIEEKDGSKVSQTTLDEVWHYTYQGSKWLLSGIEPVNPENVQVLANVEPEITVAKASGKYNYKT